MNKYLVIVAGILLLAGTVFSSRVQKSTISSAISSGQGTYIITGTLKETEKGFALSDKTDTQPLYGSCPLFTKCKGLGTSIIEVNGKGNMTLVKFKPLRFKQAVKKVEGKFVILNSGRKIKKANVTLVSEDNQLYAIPD